MSTLAPEFSPGLIDETEIASKVASGAAELDRIFPQWWERINLNRLDLMDGIQCVLGQLYGGFTYAKQELKWSYEQCDALGFYCLQPKYMTDDDFDALFRPYYREAQECWLGEIGDRLKGDK